MPRFPGSTKTHASSSAKGFIRYRHRLRSGPLSLGIRYPRKKNVNIARSEFVLEFVIHNIMCRNTSVRSSPLIVSVPGCPDLTINAKNATVCKISYERGKRISFSHSHLLSLKVSFVLVQGHGDSTVRASCSFDFFEIMSSADEQVPTVYDLEVGMDKPGGERFGVMSCSFQVIPAAEFKKINVATTRPRSDRSQVPRPTTSMSSKTTGAIPVKKGISVKRQDERTTSAVLSARTMFVPDLNLAPPSSRSAQVSSIHERYMKKNERWLGNHCSTHSDYGDQKSKAASRASSRQSNGILSGRSNRFP